ncbi:MAG: cytochrome-c peroxidase [Acidobacteriota bacterium]
MQSIASVRLCTLVVALAPLLGAPARAEQAPAAKPSAAKREVVKSGSYVLELPLGLQADAAFVPEGNPLSKEKIELGRMLYFDPRLSRDGTLACAGCHNPYHGFADPDPTSRGVGLKLGARNSPTVINRLFSAEQFWDGRAKDLEEQAHGPLLNPVEMAMPSHDEVVASCKKVEAYKPLFKAAFGSDEITMPRIAQAIATYERTVVSGNSPYDRYQAGDKDALSASQVRGLALFAGKANCVTCHVSFNFTDENYHNLGVGWDPTKKELKDLGRYEVTKRDADKGAFKTPTLRNIVETAPYMHDGSEATLRDVIELYDRGGNANPYLSPKIKPLHLTAAEKEDLLAFLLALTGDVNNLEPPAHLPGR